MKKEPEVPDSTAPAPSPAEKKPRRIFTPEERIKNKEKEIALIKEAQKLRVLERIEEVSKKLGECESAAELAGMKSEAACCLEARVALVGGEMAKVKG